MAQAQQSSYWYIRENGVDKYLIETYLLPGIATQARIGKNSRGIPLPTQFGQDQEFISLEEASSLVLDWLEENNHIYTNDKKRLLSLLESIKSKSTKFNKLIDALTEKDATTYEEFATIANELYSSRVKNPEKLATEARLRNLDTYLQSKSSKSTKTPQTQLTQSINDYNDLYSKIVRAANSSSARSAFEILAIAGIPTSGSGDISKVALAQLILNNLSELRSASKSNSGDTKSQARAISSKLNAIITESYPELTAYLNVTKDPEVSQTIDLFTAIVERELNKENITIPDIAQQKSKISLGLDDVVATEEEIYQQIMTSGLSLSVQEKERLAKTILHTIHQNYGKSLSGNQVIDLVSRNLQIDTNTIENIRTILNDEGILFAVEYRQNELVIQVEGATLTRGEYGLLSKGINPFTTIKKAESSENVENNNLLNEYRTKSSAGGDIKNLQDARSHALSNNDLHWYRKLRSAGNEQFSYDQLDANEKQLLLQTSFGRKLLEFRSRGEKIREAFYNKWVEFEEGITGKSWLNKQLDKWDLYAESFKIRGVPVFKLKHWIFEELDRWKQNSVLNLLKSANVPGSWGGWEFLKNKSTLNLLRLYKDGNYTFSGARFVFFSEKWSQFSKWTIKASSSLAKRLGSGVTYKYITVSASRTATRILLKIGGKALAKLGTKAVTALLAAATTIGGVLSAALAVLMVFDFIKLGYDFVKAFFQDKQFRATVMKWAAGFFAFTQFSRLAPIALILLAGSLQILFISLIIVGSILFIAPMISSTLNNSVHLDSGVTQLFTSVVCNENDSSSDNKTLSCAKCIAQYLTECYGKSTNKQSISKGIGCIIAKKIAPDVASIIEASATKYDYLQCVGFVQASIACSGGNLAGANACQYASNQKFGDYKFVSGLSGAKPGDPIIFNSSGTCNVDGPGHIGILDQDAGALVCLVDANSTCLGCPSSKNCLPKTRLAGYLTKSL